MKGFYLFFAFLFLLTSLNGQNAKVIIDADKGNDIDDMPAIVMAIKSGKIDAVALTTSQWNRFEVCGRQTMHENWVFNSRILKVMELEHIPSLKGAEYAVGQEQPWGVKKPNEASDFIVKKAMEMPMNEKLIVIVSGPATNVATAIQNEPKIAEKIAVYFIGTVYDFDRKAFIKNEPNSRSDLNAIETLFNAENLELRIMPANITAKLLITHKDIDTRLKSDDGIDGMLKELWKTINKDNVDWWIIWDFAIMQAVINPHLTKQIVCRTPPENAPRDIYLYTEIDTQAMMDDLWSLFEIGDKDLKFDRS